RVKILRAVLDRLIPADEFLGATGAGVDGYVVRLLETDAIGEVDAIRDGLDGVDAEAKARAGKGFCELAGREQDEVLKLVEKGEVQAKWGPPPAMWFERVVA